MDAKRLNEAINKHESDKPIIKKSKPKKITLKSLKRRIERLEEQVANHTHGYNIYGNP